MKWIEFIKVQTSANQDPSLDQALESLIKSIPLKNGLDKLTMGYNGSFSSDFALFIFWETKKIDKSGSEIGLTIKQVLNNYGLVNHSVWLVNN